MVPEKIAFLDTMISWVRVSALAALICPVLAFGTPWAVVDSPSSGPPEVIGSPSAGCLRGAARLLPQGAGYRVLKPDRGRLYGHPSLLRFIRRLAAKVQDRSLGTLLVGDLGQPRGGPTPSMHRSHQNGLDIDIWFHLEPTGTIHRVARQTAESWPPAERCT